MISICHKTNSQIKYELIVDFSETDLLTLESVLNYATKDVNVVVDVSYKNKKLVIRFSEY
jgi:hypothetical protein